MSFAGQTEVDRRLDDVARFFRTEDPEAARAILETYDVSWVYEVKVKTPLRFPAERLLGKVYENDEVVLHRVKEEM